MKYSIKKLYLGTRKQKQKKKRKKSKPVSAQGIVPWKNPFLSEQRLPEKGDEQNGEDNTIIYIYRSGRYKDTHPSTDS